MELIFGRLVSDDRHLTHSRIRQLQTLGSNVCKLETSDSKKQSSKDKLSEARTVYPCDHLCRYCLSAADDINSVARDQLLGAAYLIEDCDSSTTTPRKKKTAKTSQLTTDTDYNAQRYFKHSCHVIFLELPGICSRWSSVVEGCHLLN